VGRGHRAAAADVLRYARVDGGCGAVTRRGDGGVGADADGLLRFWSASTGAALWNLRAHRWLISGVHFEGDVLISRGGLGEMARWDLPRPSAVGSSIERFDRLVTCGSLRFEPATGGLVTQSPACEGPQP